MTLEAAAEAADGIVTSPDAAPRKRAAKTPTLVVDRKALLAAAERAKDVADSKSTLPVLGTVRVEAAGDTLSLLATNLDAWLTVHVSGVAGSLPPCCPPADKLAAAAKAARGEHVTLELRESSLVLRHDGGRASLPLLPAQEFPTVESLRGSNEAATLRVDGDSWRHALKIIEPFASHEETRYHLCGLHMVCGGNRQMRIAATDGHRLARASLTAIEDDGSKAEIIIPRATVKLIAKLPGDDLTVRLTPFRIEIEGDGVTLGSRLIDGTFPDIDRVIPSQRNEYTRATFRADDLRAGLNQVQWAAEKEGKARTVGLHIPAEGDAVFWTGKGEDASQAIARIPCEVRQPFSVGFQVPYFNDLLTYAEEIKAVGLRLDAEKPEAPMRWFVLAADGSELSDELVLMPMRMGVYQPAVGDDA